MGKALVLEHNIIKNMWQSIEMANTLSVNRTTNLYKSISFALLCIYRANSTQYSKQIFDLTFIILSELMTNTNENVILNSLHAISDILSHVRTRIADTGLLKQCVGLLDHASERVIRLAIRCCVIFSTVNGILDKVSNILESEMKVEKECWFIFGNLCATSTPFQLKAIK